MPRFLLLKHYRGGPELPHPVPPMDQWAPEDVDAHLALPATRHPMLQESGEFVDASGLSPDRDVGAVRRTPGATRSSPTARSPRRATWSRAGG